MKIDDILGLWNKDSVIDDVELDRESLNIPSLHNKYLKIYYTEKLKLKKLRIDQKILAKNLAEYYRGELNHPDDLKEMGREPWQKTVLKSDINQYVESDNDMIKILTKIVYQEEVVNLLEDILKNINNRGFQIKSAIEWRKLTNFGV